MKKYVLLSTVLILSLLLVLIGCKKSNAEKEKPKDYTSIFKNTIWTGEFNYPGKALQPVMVSFRENGELTWTALSSLSPAKWVVENGTISMSFLGGNRYSADVLNDNQLISIKNDAGNDRILASLMLNTVPEQILDYTVWKTTNLTLRFKPGYKVDVEIGAGVPKKYTDIGYVMREKTVNFSVNPSYKFFMVVNSPTTMKGANQFMPDPTEYPFELTKQ